MPWYDAITIYKGPSHDANDGSSSWDDACGTCSWNEATYGRLHANDARAPSDETSHPSHVDTHSARSDSTRQMRRGEPLSSSFVISCSTLPDHGAVILGVF